MSSPEAGRADIRAVYTDPHGLGRQPTAAELAEKLRVLRQSGWDSVRYQVATSDEYYLLAQAGSHTPPA